MVPVFETDSDRMEPVKTKMGPDQASISRNRLGRLQFNQQPSREAFPAPTLF